jgi:flagellar L-ring protein precursor FlgH
MRQNSIVKSQNIKWIGCSSLFLLLTLPGCSTSHRAVDSSSTVIPKHLYESNAKHIMKEGALWPGETSKNLLFEDSKARKVGDIVTVVINETNTSSQSATTNTSKNTTLNMQSTNILGLPSSLGVQNFLGLGTQFDPTVNASVANSNQGDGTVTRNGSLTGELSALITEVMPSGNFRIEGRRSVTVNHEEQILVLRGLIRPEDINFDNTILSRWIADASISLTGEGIIADEQRKGWLTKVLSKVWPF